MHRHCLVLYTNSPSAVPSLFSDVVSGWCRSAGFSVSQWRHQSAVCQLQLWPAPHLCGPGVKPSSGLWGRLRWGCWPGYKGCGTLLTAQKNLAWLETMTCEQWLNSSFIEYGHHVCPFFFLFYTFTGLIQWRLTEKMEWCTGTHCSCGRRVQMWRHRWASLDQVRITEIYSHLCKWS